jgi:hypothetical protein
VTNEGNFRAPRCQRFSRPIGVRPAGPAWKLGASAFVTALSVALLGAAANAQMVGTTVRAVDSASSAAASPPSSDASIASAAFFPNGVGTHSAAPSYVWSSSAPQQVVTITCESETGSEVMMRTDEPGRAMITGKCADIGKIVPPAGGFSIRNFPDGRAHVHQVGNLYDSRVGGRLADRHPKLAQFMRNPIAVIFP